jgi:hypothetical protein
MNNFEFNQSQNSFSKEFNSSVMNLINKTKQLERKQMENENEQKIPEHSKKFNIIEVIDSTRLKETIQVEKEIEQNNNHQNEIEEPMTFNPSKSNFFETSNKENCIESNRSFYNSNECILIFKNLNEKIYEEYENINNFINDIKIIENNNNDVEMVNLINSSIDQIKISRMKINEILEKSEKYLNELKDKYGSQITNKTEPTQNFENSILQFNNKEISDLYLKNSISSQNNNSYIQPMTTSMLKSNYELSSRDREYINNDLINKMNQIEEVTNIYKGKIKAYEDKMLHLNQKIKYFQELLTNSKCLIDDLSNKNKLLTAKVIKYKQLSETNQININNNYNK